MRTISTMSPVTIAVLVSFVFVGFMLALAGSIAGSYLLTIHYVDAYEAAQHAIAVKAAVPTCQALRQLAAVTGSHGTTSATYGAHLQQAFIRVYQSSGCPAILKSTGK